MESAPDSTAGPFGPFQSRGAHRLYILSMIILPILTLVGIEQYLRAHGYQYAYGWTTFHQMSAGKNNRFVFVGTSRTASAIDEKAFYEEIGKYVDGWYYGQNMGTGASKMPFHHLGVRNVYEETPESLVGTVFLVEAPCELPDYSLWTDRWWYPAYEASLVYNLRRQDLGPLWRIDIPVADRLDMTMRYLLRDVTFFDRRETLRFDLSAWGTARVQQVFSGLFGATPPAVESIDPIKTQGGVIEAGETRKQAGEKFEQYIRQEGEYLNRSWQQWDETVLADFVNMVQYNGGHVVFFDVPQTSRFETEIYRTSARARDLEAFRAQRETWGAPYIKADFQYDDGDFPDHFHLALKHTETYSRALAREYLRVYLKPPRFLEEQANGPDPAETTPGNP